MADILIITADEFLTKNLCVDLSSKGHTVRSANTGKSGLESASRVCPDVVLLDVYMATMDGFETLPKLRKIGPSAAIIAMCEDTPNLSAELLLRIARNLGARQTLMKPFSTDELDVVLHNILPGHSKSLPVFLLLDDDADSRYLNARVLQKAFPSSTVLGCSNPAEALATTESKHIDAIITDHHLGQEDGADFVKCLRTRGVDCAVLMVTGSSDPEVHKRAYRAGADRVFFGHNPNFIDYLKHRLSHHSSAACGSMEASSS